MTSQPPSASPPSEPPVAPQATATGPAGSPATSAAWNPVTVLSGLGALLFFVLVIGLVVGIADPNFNAGGNNDTVAGLLLQTALVLGLVGVAFGLARPGELLAPRELGLAPSLRRPWGPAAAAYGVYIVCALVLSVLIHPQQDDVTRELGYGQGGLADVITALLIVIAAPVSEELFFRGFMFAGIRSRAPFWVAALASAVVWGAFHFTGSGSLGVVLQLSIFGVILAWLYERTGSIRATMAVHAINNAIAFWVLTSS